MATRFMLHPSDNAATHSLTEAGTIRGVRPGPLRPCGGVVVLHRRAEETQDVVHLDEVEVVERGQDVYLKSVVDAGGEPARALVWVQQSFADEGETPRLPAKDLAALTIMEREGKLTATQAKTVLGDMLAAGGGDPAAIAAAKGFEALDTSSIAKFVDDAIAAQPDAWAKYCAGEEKAAGALVGSIMKASKGKADGKVVTALLQERRGS